MPEEEEKKTRISVERLSVPIALVCAIVGVPLLLFNAYADDQEKQNKVITELRMQQETHQAVFEEKMANVSKVLDRIVNQQEQIWVRDVDILVRLSQLETKVENESN